MSVLLVLGGVAVNGLVVYVAVMFGVQHGMAQHEVDRTEK